MSNDLCAQAQSHFQRIFNERRSVPPAPHIYAHVASCPLCRGALALLLTNATGVRQPPRSISCETCQRDLAAFIDLERAEGNVSARESYPRVWWHLWTCEQCADVYRLTRDLLAYPPAGWPQRRQLFFFDRGYMNALLGDSYVSRGARRGGAGLPIMVAESEPGEEPIFSFEIQEQHDELWSLYLTMEPAPEGWLVATLGEFSARVRFDAKGRATITGVPPLLLLSADGPDIDFSAEEDA